MANRIAGITVEIGGDTTKLSTTLKSLIQKLRVPSHCLGDVNNLLKLDPGNTELITQKHKLLAQAVSETKEKLAQLKEAAQQANEKLASGEIWAVLPIESNRIVKGLVGTCVETDADRSFIMQRMEDIYDRKQSFCNKRKR